MIICVGGTFLLNYDYEDLNFCNVISSNIFCQCSTTQEL